MSDRTLAAIAFVVLGTSLATSLVSWVVEPIADELVRRIIIAAGFVLGAGGGVMLFLAGEDR